MSPLCVSTPTSVFHFFLGKIQSHPKISYAPLIQSRAKRSASHPFLPHYMNRHARMWEDHLTLLPYIEP